MIVQDTLNSQRICKLGDVAYFGEFSKLGKNFCLLWRALAKLSYSVTKTFYEALTCIRTLKIIVMSDLHINQSGILYILKQNLFAQFLLCKLFYQPNLEMSSLR